MNQKWYHTFPGASAWIILFAGCCFAPRLAANPADATVVQGTATFSTSGSQLTIRTSDRAYLNWQSFNIGAGETTTFVQPSSASVVWNNINDPNPSQILGNLNANGYVILQNQSGFFIGGQAMINAHGLLMTTTPTPMPDLFGGGAWVFNTPPPSASVINYGTINLASGGSVFLIAHEVENHGTISAPAGRIGLHAADQVLVSERRDGRGLSAQVTLPNGSVDNSGALIADAGTIAMHAQVVNQGGLVQANSVREVNGTIELVAGDAVNLEVNSAITAKGDAQVASAGGTVRIQAGNTFTDQTGSTINIAGSAQGGNGGRVEISAASLGPLQSTVEGQARDGFRGGRLAIATYDLTLDGAYVASLNAQMGGGLSLIDLRANNDITLSVPWTLADQTAPTTLSLTARNNLLLDSGASLNAGRNWSVNLAAGGDVTLASGSTVAANAGAIAIHANTIHQNGTLQADSIGGINGTVELAADDALNLGATSILSARGDSAATTPSPGGFVVLKAGKSFADVSGSAITVAGTLGGQDGIIEVLCDSVDVGALHSSLGSYFGLLINPFDLTLSGHATDLSSTSPNLNLSDLSRYARIDLHAADNITLSSPWTLTAQNSPASLNLSAGNSIILNDASYLNGGKNWSVSLTAGPLDLAARPTTPRSAGVYLDGSSYIQTVNGDINVWAANEVLINADPATSSINGIRTVGETDARGNVTTPGGNISVTAFVGDVNTGGNTKGFVNYKPALSFPSFSFYTVDSSLGGISTAAGGDITINAGGNVTSFLPKSSSGTGDAGTGAFGRSPGNLTITAQGSVYGHYVLANGLGTFTAGQDIGNDSGDVALSLIKGSWNLDAPNGNISLQEVRNPNGIFNNISGGSNAGRHLLDYDPFAAVSLEAGLGVYLTGQNVPRPNDGVSIIYPPTLDILAGAGGVVLEKTVILFPSAHQDLQIGTSSGGSLVAQQTTTSTTTELIMSDSAQTRWLNTTTFGDGDHGPAVFGLNDPNPVTLNLAGNIEDLVLYATKAARITAGGDMINSSFSGQNLRASDVTSIDVKGQLFNRSPYSFQDLPQGIPRLPASNLPSGANSSWEAIFSAALDPNIIATLSVPKGLPPNQWAAYVAQNALLFVGGNPGFVYNPATKRFGFTGDMSSRLSAQQLAALESGAGLTVLRYDAFGNPVVDVGGHFVTDTVAWAAPAAISVLYTASLGAPAANDSTQFGYRVGGPGEFDVHAGSISLGNSLGILSCGVGQPPGGNALYAKLAPFTPSGANLNVSVDGNLDMLSSTIATLGGGNLNVSAGGSMNLGSPELSGARGGTADLAFGIFSTGRGNVNVTAIGNVDINGSRIAAYNGGNVSVRSLMGNVDAGAGGAVQANLYYFFVDPASGQAEQLLGGVYGSGILATTLPSPPGAPVPPGAALQPGNITVATPRGDILSSEGGILQEALNGNVAPGPTVTLVAGTVAADGSPGYQGNINLGDSGVIGGAVDLQANGNITGLVISRQNSTVNAAQNFSGTVVSGGTANLSAGGSISGTVFGVGGIKASGDLSGATLLGQNVSANGGAAQSTLGNSATASAASQSASAQSGSETKEQLASNGDDDDEKKKKRKSPLLKRVGRVTVILPKTG